MKRQKINIVKSVFSLLLSAIFCVLFASSSHALDYTLQLQVIEPTDMCPNIPGTQASIPSGMQLDTNGNCYTPTPPPVTTDLCNNLSGVQTSLPAGYYRTSGGNCYPQPTPPAAPVDVCPNLEGVQSAVPDGYYLDTDGNCNKIPEQIDMCPNIDGPQATIPDGMVLENNVCYTPTSTVTNPPATPQNPSSSTVKNFPGFLQPIAQTLVNLIPENTRGWLRSLPVQVAQAVPYYIFVIVTIVALIPILQAVREAIFVRQLVTLLKRERDIAEQKDNFMSLASHYLRTPLTLMKSGLETIVSLNELPAETVQPLNLQLTSLDSNIKQILANVEQNSALSSIKQPTANTAIPSVWRSGWFWGPIIASIILAAVANFLLVIVGEKTIVASNTFFQFLVAAVSFFILYLGVRNLHLQRKLHEENQLLVTHEKTIDEARNTFISETTVTLRDGLEPIEKTRSIIDNAPSAKYFDEGYGRMASILERFLLLGHVQTGAERNLEVFELREAIDQLLVTYHEAISAKRIVVTNGASTTFIKQDHLLFNFVLGSVLDNAIKFNQEGGHIEIGAEPISKMLHIIVSDNGIGIDDEKLGQLFKPFSRATSAVEFNYEGLGFSLFLDKIIMDYTDGNISAESKVNKGTLLRVATPLSLEII